MNIREITALRKAGNISEALRAAETEFERSINKYTVGALFWCLNDLYKQQTPSDAIVTIERMRALYEKFGTDDTFMHHAIENTSLYNVPYYHKLKDALIQAREGSVSLSVSEGSSLKPVDLR